MVYGIAVGLISLAALAAQRARHGQAQAPAQQAEPMSPALTARTGRR